MLVLEGEVFKLCLDGKQPQAMGQRSIYVQSLAGNLVLLVGGHRAEGTHIVEAVGHLDEHHPYILAHGEQQLAEILGLRRRLVAEYTTGNLGETLHELGYLRAKLTGDVFHRIVGILDHIMEQRRAYRCRAEADLLAGNLGHGYGVHDIRLAGAAAHSLVRLLGKAVCTLDDLHLLAVIAAQVAIEHVGKGSFDHAVFFFRSRQVGIHRSRYFQIDYKNTLFAPIGKIFYPAASAPCGRYS